MSGHSKWSTIKRQKGAADIKRGMTFTKIANSITIATKLGGSGDPQSNPRLKAALESARAANMPKDNVQRAVDRGLGKLPGQTLDEVIYEGYGPGKAAFIVESVTDNKLRTLQEVRNIFERAGGSLGGSGSTSFMFERQGEIKISGKGRDRDEEILEIIDLGAEDVEDFMEDNMQVYLVSVASPELNTMSNNLTQKGYVVKSAETIFKPTVFSEIQDKEIAKKILDFSEKLEELDDIQKVYSNFEISDDS